ncbi:MAG: type II toxin-antitoxin system prevent-host-death family antitoxin [Longimicrobiales bacterium]|nr:type II toxin-antitoxin system prevent-host-death family antitoxin [Longimicrobiales bacterium]
MVTVGSYEAKTRLPELLRMVGVGERITITRHGRPIALLVPAPGAPERTVDEAIRELAEFGKGRSLGSDLTLRDLIEDGRR